MGIVKKKTTTAKPETKKTEDVIVGQDSITVKIRKGTEYSKEAIEIGRTISITADDDANDKIGELIGELDGIAEEYISQYAANGSFDESADDESEQEEDSEEIDELDEETIRGMGKVELKKFIKENDIDVDPSEYKKLDDLKDAVIEALSGEGDGEESEEDESEEGEEETVDEETIRGMDRKELIEFIKDNDLGVNPKDYKKLADLQEAVIEQISEAGEEEEGLTSDDVMEMDREQLIELIKENELGINPKKYKKTSELAEAVCEELFTEEDGDGDFDDTDFEEE